MLEVLGVFVVLLVVSSILLIPKVRALRRRRAELLATHRDPEIVDAMMRDRLAKDVPRSNRVPRWLSALSLLVFGAALAAGVAFATTGPEMLMLTIFFVGVGLWGTVASLHMLITGRFAFWGFPF